MASKKHKREVRLTACTLVNPDTHRKEVGVMAATYLGNRRVFVTASDEPTALRMLEDKVRREQAEAEIRAQYPKKVEVSW